VLGVGLGLGVGWGWGLGVGVVRDGVVEEGAIEVDTGVFMRQRLWQ